MQVTNRWLSVQCGVLQSSLNSLQSSRERCLLLWSLAQLRGAKSRAAKSRHEVRLATKQDQQSGWSPSQLAAFRSSSETLDASLPGLGAAAAPHVGPHADQQLPEDDERLFQELSNGAEAASPAGMLQSAAVAPPSAPQAVGSSPRKGKQRAARSGGKSKHAVVADEAKRSDVSWWTMPSPPVVPPTDFVRQLTESLDFSQMSPEGVCHFIMFEM